jgi:hypothetical protein
LSTRDFSPSEAELNILITEDVEASMERRRIPTIKKDRVTLHEIEDLEEREERSSCNWGQKVGT